MKMNKPDNIEKYQGNYSESGFWNKVKKVALKAGAKVIYVALIWVLSSVPSAFPIPISTTGKYLSLRLTRSAASYWP